MSASIRPVGSYVTGLYLPTSDIDMLITFLRQTGTLFGGYLTHLYIVIRKIRDSGFASKVKDVLRVNVPLNQGLDQNHRQNYWDSD